MSTLQSIKDNKLLNDLCKEYEIKLSKNLETRKIYEEIENFKDAEYIYCIAYEMLIRTDDYNKLLEEYRPLKNKSKLEMTNEEFVELRKLINRMNQLGLKKTSFLGFDCDDDHDNVFKRIEYYDEIANTPWSVRMLHKFEFDSNENLFYVLAKFYCEKGELYILKDDYYCSIAEKANELVINQIKNKSQWKTDKEYQEFYDILDNYYIPCRQLNDNIEHKSLASNSIYLNELDEDFLSLLKEKQTSDLLIPIKSNFSHHNVEFWYKFGVNDIKNGLNKLVDFHVSHNLIYDKSGMNIDVSTNQILKNPTNFYIPCVNRMEKPQFIQWNQMNDEIPENSFQEQLKYSGHDYIIAREGWIKVKREDIIYLINIDKYISLSYLHDSFLETLEYEDLKNKYIETEPLFSRPRLMFDKARLTNIPINLNLSKEDLLLYISQIKDDYDANKNIVKHDKEYFFNLTLESDEVQMPENIKYVSKDKPSTNKRILPVKRDAFKKRLALAFYIYDLYILFLPLFKKKKKEIRDKRDLNIEEKRKNSKNGGIPIDTDEQERIKDNAESDIAKYNEAILMAEICSLIDYELSDEQVKYYLTVMKEFIHGVNQKNENNVLKKQYNSNKQEDTEPKYKNLIIGDSYIIKSTQIDLVKNLFR